MDFAKETCSFFPLCEVCVNTGFIYATVALARRGMKPELSRRQQSFLRPLNILHNLIIFPRQLTFKMS